MYYYKTEQYLPVTINDAWNFFSSPANLKLITPPKLDFKIISQFEDKEIYEGMIIDYKVKPLFGIPVSWKTEICKVKVNCYFTDRQLKGPYSVWEHCHIFVEKEGGILMLDQINYELPFGLVGNFAHSIFVRREIVNIFEYRRKILEQLFIKK